MGSKSNTVYEYWCDMCKAPISDEKQIVPYFNVPTDGWTGISCTHERIDLCDKCRQRPISDLLIFIQDRLRVM